MLKYLKTFEDYSLNVDSNIGELPLTTNTSTLDNDYYIFPDDEDEEDKPLRDYDYTTRLPQVRRKRKRPIQQMNIG